MKKSLIAIAIVSTFGLAGCGSDSGSGSSTPAATSTSFSGTVNKGIVSNGKVEICSDFAGSTCETDGSYYQTATTSETGSYDVIGAPLNTPLLVLVSKQDSTTTMKCDTDSCIDNSASPVDFGDTFEVAENWTLKTIIPAANSATTTVNVTSLTDIAADEAIEVAGEDGVITEAIAKNANIAVQKAFGLTSGITEIGALDLTDAEAVAANINNPEELKAATYSAVLLNVSDEAKAALVTFDSSTGGYSVTASSDNSGDISVTSLLDDAETLLTTTVETETNTARVESGAEPISVASVVSSIESTDIPESTTAIEPTTEVAAAKAFITDIRTAYNAVQDEGDLKTGLEDFSDELEGIDDLITDDLDAISDNLANAVASIAEALDDASDDATEYTDAEYIVTIKDDIYTIGAEGEDVYIVATVINNTTSESSECFLPELEEGVECTDDHVYIETDKILGDASLKLTTVLLHSGDTSLSADGSATLEGGSNTSVFSEDGDYYNDDADNTKFSENDEEYLTIDSLDIKLNATLSYESSESTDPTTASFKGNLTFSFHDLDYSGIWLEDSIRSTDTDMGTTHTNVYTNSTNFTVSDMKLTLDGDLTANTEQVNIDLSLTVDNSSKFTYIDKETETYTNNWSTAWVQHSGSSDFESENNEETADNFVTVTAIASVEIELFDADGDKTTASIKLEANRNQYDAVDTTVTINYNDVATVLQADIGLYDAQDSDLTIKNTTGALATINAFDEDVDYTGTITIDGVEAATITEIENGAVLVRYTDGTFESLF